MLKAIINQTRSIGNEFLVINIKADTEAGWRRAVCGQGCRLARFSPAGHRTINISVKRNRHYYNPGAGHENENWANNSTSKKASHGAYIFVYLFISWPEATTATRPLLLTKTITTTKIGLNFTPNSHRVGPGMQPCNEVFARKCHTPAFDSCSLRPGGDRWVGGEERFSCKFKLIEKNAGFQKVTNRASCTKGLPKSQRKV